MSICFLQRYIIYPKIIQITKEFYKNHCVKHHFFEINPWFY